MAFPGFIDLHGDMLERDIEPRPAAVFPIDLSVFELDKRLACVGITTSFVAVRFRKTRHGLNTGETAKQIIQAVNELRPRLLVDFFIHARYDVSSPCLASSVLQVIESGQVQLVSLMDHTFGQGQYRNMKTFYDLEANVTVVQSEGKMQKSA